MSVAQPDSLKAEIDERVPDLVALRRDLHEHPETAFEEVRTSGIVAQRLHSLGLEVHTGIAKTGVVAYLHGSKEGGGKTLAIRADMDALPVEELNEIEYRSQIEGKMHACGHDGHTSILLTVAELLTRRRDDFAGTVKFIFQPAEEGAGGAAMMTEEGVMEDVDNVIGLHLITTFPIGRVGVYPGTIFAAADKIRLTVHGKGGHGGMPDTAVDPIMIAAHIITALQSLVSRETSPFSPAVVTIGMIHAGTASNIIPETVEMLGTTRAFSQEQRSYLHRRIDEIASGIANSMRGSCDTSVFAGCPPCINDATVTDLVRRAAIKTLGEDAVDTGREVQLTAADDMSHFLNAAPGCYFIVGARNEQKGALYPHHHPHFNIDEDALPIAVEVFTRAALDYFR